LDGYASLRNVSVVLVQRERTKEGKKMNPAQAGGSKIKRKENLKKENNNNNGAFIITMI